MIMGGDRLPVIENIKKRVDDGDFNSKVELSDPVLTPLQEREITDGYLKKRTRFDYKFKCLVANTIANVGGYFINRNTEVVGSIDPEILKSGVIITSNHFSPFENTVIRSFLRKNGVRKLNVLSQVSNFAMGGFVGFLMNYARTIPLSSNMRYLTRDLTNVLREKISNEEAILIYPEQEMWFNYRKPRPHKEGAYYFASKLNTPIVSCFVEMIELNELDTMDFYKIKYRLHILGVIYPDKNKSGRENRKQMCIKDYEMKKNAYERIYGKPLVYKFESSDIAGWIDYSLVYEDE